MRFILLLILSTFHASASVPLQLSDKQLASKTDHVFEAHVVGVDMIDDKGHQVTNDKAMTGPSCFTLRAGPSSSAQTTGSMM